MVADLDYHLTSRTSIAWKGGVHNVDLPEVHSIVEATELKGPAAQAARFACVWKAFYRYQNLFPWTESIMACIW